MPRYLVDTNILIYHLSGNKKATQFIDKHKEQLSISFITYIELLSHDFEEGQEKQVREFLQLFELLELTFEIIEQSVNFRKLKKVKLPDCIVAATAKINHMALVTRNEKDFSNFNIRIINPIDQEINIDLKN